FIEAIVPVNTAPWADVNSDKQLAELEAQLAGDHEWYGGRYYDKAACTAVLTDIRVETLKRYGIETALAPRFPDPAAREAAIRELGRQMGRQLADHPAPRPPRLRHQAGFRQDQGQGALHLVPHRRA